MAESLIQRILAALHAAGVDLGVLRRDDLIALDEFHVKGRAATRDLARRAGLASGMRVLDVGGGVGGAARTLAAEFGCTTTVIDANEDYCQAAAELSARVGLAPVRCVRADALALPFAAGAYDVVWMQHVAMAVADKAGLWAELRRVLRPGGLLALYEIGAGRHGPMRYPVPWADEPGQSFVEPLEALRDRLAGAGWIERLWLDDSADCAAWYRAMLARHPPESASLSPALLTGPDYPLRARTMARNLAEGRLRVIMALWARAD